MQEGSNNGDGQASGKRPWWKKAIRWIAFLLLGLLLLILLLLLAFQFEPVQNWAAGKAANMLSKKTGAKVEVGSFKLDPFRQLVLEDLLIRGTKGDTLFSAGLTEIQFDKPLTSLFKRRIYGTDITLRNGLLHVKRDAGEALNNLEKIFGLNPYFIPEEKQIKEITPAFILNTDQIFLESFCFLNEDEVKGKYESYCVDEAVLVPQMISFTGPRFELKDLYLNQPVVKIVQYPYDSLFADSLDRLRATADSMYYYKEGVDPPFFFLETQNATIKGGRFQLDNRRKSKGDSAVYDQAINWSELDLFDMNMELENFKVQNFIFEGRVEHIGFETNKGFRLDTLSSDQVYVSPDSLHVLDMIFKSPQSRLWADVHMDYDNYSDFGDFADGVFLNINFGQGTLLISDLLTFVPGLENVGFFSYNRNKKIRIDGRLLGTINTLIGQDLEVAIGDKTLMKGQFDSRNLAIKGEELLHFNLERFTSSMPALRSLIPDFDPPARMNKLGRFNFQGRFDGYFRDFVAYGKLNTALGTAEMDMRMDLTSGRSDAAYSGSIELREFDLGRFTENPDLGRITLVAEVEQGRGLTLDNLQAKLDAQVQSFQFKGYNYRNADLVGSFDGNVYEGYFEISEENIDLHFDGRVQLNEKDPQFDISGELNHIDLDALNISEKPLALSGNFTLNIDDPDFEEFSGQALVTDFVLDGDTIRYGRFDSIRINAFVDKDSLKHLEINSSLVNAEFTGHYRLMDLPDVLANRMLENHPEFARYFNLRGDSIDIRTDMQFDIEIGHTANFTRLFTDKLDTLKNIRLNGFIDRPAETYRIEASFPELSWDNMYFDRLYLLVDGEEEYSNLVLSLDGARIGERMEINPFTLFLDLRSDTVDFTANTANFQEFLDNLNLEGKAYLTGDKWQLEFLNSTLQLFGDQWQINEDNFLRIGKNYLKTHQLAIQNENRILRFENIDTTGLSVEAEGLELSILEGLVKIEKLDFSGILEGSARIPDIFKSRAVSGEITIDSFAINGDPYGQLELSSSLLDENTRLSLDLSVRKDSQQLNGEGFLVLPGGKMEREGEIALDFTVQNYPLSFLEYFITDGIHNTVGSWNGGLRLEGPFSDISLDGQMIIYNGATTVDILGVRYFVDGQTADISSDFIDLGGVVMQDQYGNSAQISGGLLHDNFANFALDARIRSDRILVLNTTKADNPVYYGHSIGTVDARFSGSFELPVIGVDAENRENTVLNIRVNEEVENTGLSYIDFRLDTAANGALLSSPEARGVDFTLNLTANPEAQVRIIFDEEKRDVIEGNGEGYLSLHLSRSGEFTMFGDYTINSGEYLFTNALSVIEISKPFTVSPGSTLQWTGDPFNAYIDIQAIYRGLSAPPYNFIQEYLNTGTADQDFIEEAKNPTDIELVLYLTNTLQQPDINFDIRFPDLTGQLETLVQRKLEELSFDQNQLNMQAAALLTFRDFMPTSITRDDATRLGVQVIANTLSEYLTNQISFYLTNLFRRALEDVSFIENYEFDFGVVLPSGEYIQQGQGIFDARRREIILGNRFNLFSERLEVNLKGNIVNESVYAPGGYFKPYAALEYILTPNRRWRLRVYTQSDIGPQGVRRNKHGVGITFRKEFYSVEEMNCELKRQQAIREEEENQKEEDAESDRK